MSDFSRVVVGIFAVVASPAALAGLAAFAPAGQSSRLRLLAIILVPLFALLALAAVLNGPFLDWLDVSGENFQLAAGLVMLPLALTLLWSGRREVAVDAGPLWRGWTLVFGPSAAVLALSYAARFGTGTTLAGIAVALLASTALLLFSSRIAAWLGRSGCSMLGRLNGALIVVMAVELILDGIHSV